MNFVTFKLKAIDGPGMRAFLSRLKTGFGICLRNFRQSFENDVGEILWHLDPTDLFLYSHKNYC